MKGRHCYVVTRSRPYPRGGAFEGASRHAGKLTRGFNRRGQAET